APAGRLAGPVMPWRCCWLGPWAGSGVWRPPIKDPGRLPAANLPVGSAGLEPLGAGRLAPARPRGASPAGGPISHGQIGFIQNLYAAFGRADLPAMLGALTSDIDWWTIGTGDYPTFGQRKGHAAVQQFFVQVAENEEFSDFSPREFYAADDKVFVLGTFAGK